MPFRGELARYILKRGLFLCVLLLAVTVALVFRARQGGPLAPRFYDYAAAFHFSAGVAFGCGLLGSVLAEDILGHDGE